MPIHIRVLTMVDTFTRLPRRLSHGSVSERPMWSKCSRVPKAIRVDQGAEFVSRDLDLWAYQRGVTLDFSRPGKPTDNALQRDRQ